MPNGEASANSIKPAYFQHVSLIVPVVNAALDEGGSELMRVRQDSIRFGTDSGDLIIVLSCDKLALEVRN